MPGSVLSLQSKLRHSLAKEPQDMPSLISVCLTSLDIFSSFSYAFFFSIRIIFLGISSWLLAFWGLRIVSSLRSKSVESKLFLFIPGICDLHFISFLSWNFLYHKFSISFGTLFGSCGFYFSSCLLFLYPPPTSISSPPSIGKIL